MISRSRKKGFSKLLSLPFGGFRSTSLIFTLGGVVLFAASAMNPSTLQGVRLVTTDFVAPAMAFVNKPFEVAAEYVTTVTGIAQLQTEVAQLRQENARLREWHDVALNLQAENKNLSSLLRLKLPESTGYITARLISDAGNTFAQSALVLAGQPDGVVKGQAVLSGDGLIGRVIESGQKASRILLLNDVNSRVPVMIEGTEIRAILAGQNHPYPLLDHLPLDFKPQAGLRVVTSGNGGLFLPGLPVGMTFLDEHGQVYVQMFSDLDRMNYVRIVDRVLDKGILEGQISPVPSKQK